QAATYPLGQGQDHPVQLAEVGEPSAEGLLGSHRLGAGPSSHRPGVLVVGERPQMVGLARPQPGDERLDRRPGQVADGGAPGVDDATMDSMGVVAGAPTVATPASRSFLAGLGPTPHSTSMGSGARNSASVPASTWTGPSGLATWEATLAGCLVVATPIETGRPISSRTSLRISRAIWGAGQNRCSEPRTSRNASSTEICSMSGVKRSKISITRSE